MRKKSKHYLNALGQVLLIGVNGTLSETREVNVVRLNGGLEGVAHGIRP